MEFKTQRIYTGKETRVSQKTGQEYTIVNFLDDNGQSFGVISKCKVPDGIKQLQLCNVKFKVNVGRYTQLELMSCDQA